MVRRNCVLDGARVPCYVVDPDHGQGARWWATDQVDGGAVASGMAPLSAPFYVVERNGFEERHWLAEDTGYPIDIAARRRLGHNARPRDGQPGSGLEWFDHSSLCDQARPKMGCAPPPKAPPAKKPAVQPAKNPAAAKPAPTKPALEHFPLFQPFAGAGE